MLYFLMFTAKKIQQQEEVFTYYLYNKGQSYRFFPFTHPSTPIFLQQNTAKGERPHKFTARNLWEPFKN